MLAHAPGSVCQKEKRIGSEVRINQQTGIQGFESLQYVVTMFEAG